MRLSLYTEKQLKLDFLVATNRRAIVATNEPAGASRFVVARQKAFVETIEFDFDALRLKDRDICSNNP